MNKQKIIAGIIILFSTSSLLLSCADNKQGVGATVGTITGGLIGAQFGKGSGKIFTTIIGAMAGAGIGSAIGKDLDDKDRQLMQQSSQQALESAPSGTSIKWNNPDSKNNGVITPIKTFKANQGTHKGRYCREFTQTINIGGRSEKAYAIACRMPDGVWRISQQE